MAFVDLRVLRVDPIKYDSRRPHTERHLAHLLWCTEVNVCNVRAGLIYSSNGRHTIYSCYTAGRNARAIKGAIRVPDRGPGTETNL